MFVQHHNFGTQPMLRCGQAKRSHNSTDHIHQFFELDMIFDGEIEITLGNKTVVARAGDMAIIPAFSSHAFHTPDNVKMFICVFPGVFLSGAYSSDMLLRPRQTHVFKPSKPLWQYLVDSEFSSMWGHYVYDEKNDAAEIGRLCAIFHMIMAEYYAAVPLASDGEYYAALPKVLSYMSAHYTEDLSLKSVGAALGYSPKYVSNCLTAMPNFNFRRLLNSMRIERAKELLRSTDMSNYEIATASGFNTECSFHRVFRDFVGTTPGEYRTVQ